MWVWSAKLLLTPDAEAQLLQFCRRHGVGTLYLAAYDLRPPLDRVYRAFNRKAHEAGLAVHALAGDPRWGKPQYHHIPLGWVDQVRRFNRQAAAGERFDGIHTDIEVYLLSKSWEERPEYLLGGYLDLTRAIAEQVAQDPEPLFFSADVPFWFDDDISYRILWNGAVKPPSHHVMDHTDSVTVLAYRNYAEGSDGTVQLILMELGYAERIGKQLVIGQETQEGLFPDYVTFGGTSCGRFREEMRKIEKAVQHRAGFGGFAVHHYESYRKLCGK